MRYRKLDMNGDYTFGQGVNNFYTDSREGVAQAIKTNLGLRQGEWFLDLTVGTPYSSKILGAGKVSTYDAAIRSVILNTQGVLNIASYSSGVDPNTRRATVNCTVNTLYGQVPVSTNL